MQSDRLSVERMMRLAASGVAKVDRLGRRGITLCSMDEIEAMAMLIVASDALPGHPGAPARQPLYPQIEKDRA